LRPTGTSATRCSVTACSTSADGAAPHRRGKIVPARDPQAAVAKIQPRRAAGRQRLDSAEEGTRGGVVEAGLEIGPDRVLVGLARHVRQREKRGDLARRDEAAVAEPREIERLDAETVAHEVERMSIAVVDREGEHPDAVVQHRLATRGEALEQHFRVAVAAPPRRRAHARPQPPEIHHLAVIGDRPSAVGARHRLAGRGGQVEDRQAQMSERQPSAIQARDRPGVGAAVGHGVERDVDLCRTRAAGTPDGDEAAHQAASRRAKRPSIQSAPA
jgi:hypothetical protein